MNLVIHHLKKDMRYLRLLLVLWFALLLVNSLVIRSGLDRFITSGEGIEVLSAAYVLLYVLQQILQIVIVCQLVQGDALAGTTAFWLTRPISRKQLLLSKSLFVLLILLLPSLLAEVIVLWINGIPVSHMLSALAAETLLQNAIFLVPAVLVAALTPNLGRLVIVGSTSITAFFLIHYAIVAFVMSLVAGSRRLPSGSFPGQWPMIFPTNPSGLLFSVFLATGLGAMVIVYQYLTRTTANSARGAALGMFLVITTLNFWSWDLRAFNRGLPSRSGLSPASVKLVISRELRAATPMGHVGNVTILGGWNSKGSPPASSSRLLTFEQLCCFQTGKWSHPASITQWCPFSTILRLRKNLILSTTVMMVGLDFALQCFPCSQWMLEYSDSTKALQEPTWRRFLWMFINN